MKPLLATKTRIYFYGFSWASCFCVSFYSHTLRWLSFFSRTRIIYNLRIEHKGLQYMCVHFFIDTPSMSACVRILTHTTRTWVFFPLNYCKPSWFSFLLRPWSLSPFIVNSSSSDKLSFCILSVWFLYMCCSKVFRIIFLSIIILYAVRFVIIVYIT